MELKGDLVHLTEKSYSMITGQVIFHIQQQFPHYSIIPNPPPPYTYKLTIRKKGNHIYETSEENELSYQTESIQVLIETIEPIKPTKNRNAS